MLFTVIWVLSSTIFLGFLLTDITKTMVKPLYSHILSLFHNANNKVAAPWHMLPSTIVFLGVNEFLELITRAQAK